MNYTFTRNLDNKDPMTNVSAEGKAHYQNNHIAKKNLKDGVWYSGRCRNSSQARWVASKERFEYVRVKFSMRFVEEICAPEDDDRYDVFYAMKEIPESEVERKIPAIVQDPQPGLRPGIVQEAKE